MRKRSQITITNEISRKISTDQYNHRSGEIYLWIQERRKREDWHSTGKLEEACSYELGHGWIGLNFED